MYVYIRDALMFSLKRISYFITYELFRARMFYKHMLMFLLNRIFSSRERMKNEWNI